ncbi:ABC transporter ATP-binding protein [Jiella sonneratiae]|uniref:ABC transporter ATP-binding protein n=1 Tax=Jiella sonneratiae TaxID=2816856 RepID=A0ABS3J864_9HYPH|nr:ABC transporter ATP-binding protein [Jiella sonneratiae]MBO0905859.1 ABC transporter ATP-binding protein [Jiella sonneratiae]
MQLAESPPDSREDTADVPLFRVEDVGFAAGGRPILRDLSLRLEPGLVHGLIGPNGSGKSTLVRLLARQTVPSRGTICFAGRPIEGFGRRDFARRLAYLPQTPPATDGMTGRELVALGRYPWHGPLGRLGRGDRDAIEAAMARTDTEGFADRQVSELSGGERQRVWLAMLLAQETGCLVLDEPTSALDVAHQAEMLGLVRRLSQDRRLSVVIVLHDINMAAQICDRLVALREGRIVADGGPAAIMRPEVLEAIYGVRMGILKRPDAGPPIGYVK